MAYIPSAWDNPNLQHGVQSFLQSILKGVAPDFVAQQTFQQMAQQDPTLIETISNMDDGARETYSKQVLGSKNKNPLEKIGIGAKRQAREEQAAAIAGLTPAQLAERKAALAGTRTTGQIDQEKIDNERKGTLFDQTVTRNNQDIEKDSFTLEKLNAARSLQDKAWEQYPELEDVNLEKLAKQVTKGTANPLALKRIEGTPAELVLKEAVETERKKMAHDEDLSMLGARTAAERSLMRERQSGSTPDALLDRARIFGSAVAEKNNKVVDADNQIKTMLTQNRMLSAYLSAPDKMKKQMVEKGQISPDDIAKYQSFEKEKADAKEEANFYAKAQRSVLEKLPEMLKKSESTNDEQAPSPKAAAVEADISSGKLTLESALAIPSIANDPAVATYLKKKFSKSAPTIKVKG